MSAKLDDLIAMAAYLCRRIDASTAPRTRGVARVRRMLAAGIERTSRGEVSQSVGLIRAHDAFYALPEAREILNGWEPEAELPDRDAIIAALELESPRRVLSFAFTSRGPIPSHAWTLGDHSPVRVEILEGTTREQVREALQWVLGLLPTLWPRLIHPMGATIIADFMADEDFPATQRALQAQADAEAARTATDRKHCT